MTTAQKTTPDQCYELLMLEGHDHQTRTAFVYDHLRELWTRRGSVELTAKVVPRGVRLKEAPPSRAKSLILNQPAMVMHASPKVDLPANPLKVLNPFKAVKMVAQGLGQVSGVEKRFCIPLKPNSLSIAEDFVPKLLAHIETQAPSLVQATTLVNMVDYNFYIA